MPKASKKISPKIISISILIAFIPIYGYFAAYVHEIGFCRQFQIPLEFVEISLNEVLKVMSIAIPIVLLLFIGWIFSLFTQMFTNPVLRILGRSIFPLFAFVLLIVPFGGNLLEAIIVFLIAWFIMIGSDFVFPLFSRQKFKGYYKKKLEQYEEFDKKIKNPLDAIVDLVMDQIGVLTFMIIFLFLFALAFFVHPMGESIAKKQKSFMIIKSEPELVILRKYSKNFICAPFDRNKKEIKKSFYIKNVDQIAEEGFEVVMGDIGPLQVTKTKTNKKDKKKIKGTKNE